MGAGPEGKPVSRNATRAVTPVGDPPGGNSTAPDAAPATGTDGAPHGTGGVSASVEPLPPAPNRPWTAGVEWRRVGPHRGEFRVVARDLDDREGITIAKSRPLRWPPTDHASVRALVEAAGALQRALLDVGWSLVGQGDAWYAMRFAWSPVAATQGAGTPPRPASRTQQRRAWPEGTERLWRCELAWHPGYIASRFIAVVHAPDEAGRGREIARSEAVRGLPTAEPDPDSDQQRAAVSRLAAALEAMGWERVARGRSWYPERFVWRREEEPPLRVDPIEEPAPGKAKRFAQRGDASEAPPQSAGDGE